MQEQGQVRKCGPAALGQALQRRLYQKSEFQVVRYAELDRGALAAIEDGHGAEYVTAVFAAIWGKPADLTQRPVLIGVLKRAGFDAPRLIARASHVEIVAKLEAETKAAAERGVFGAPTMFVGEQMFFGNDRLDFVSEALRSAL
jgi:2-hydroxychromene-2-carboxylate isomerase